MPHLIFELPKTFKSKKLDSFILSIHSFLSKNLPTEIESCKSRIYFYENLYCSNNQEGIFLTVKILKGRSIEKQIKVSNTLKNKLDSFFNSNGEKFQTTVEIIEINQTYIK